MKILLLWAHLLPFRSLFVVCLFAVVLSRRFPHDDLRMIMSMCVPMCVCVGAPRCRHGGGGSSRERLGD